MTKNQIISCLIFLSSALFLSYAAFKLSNDDASTHVTSENVAFTPIKELKGNEFQSMVENSDIPVLIDVYTSWCTPCKRMMPHLESLNRKMQGKVRFFKVNADTERALARELKAPSVPTLILYKGGKQVAKQTGALSEEGLRRFIESN